MQLFILMNRYCLFTSNPITINNCTVTDLNDLPQYDVNAIKHEFVTVPIMFKICKIPNHIPAVFF